MSAAATVGRVSVTELTGKQNIVKAHEFVEIMDSLSSMTSTTEDGAEDRTLVTSAPAVTTIGAGVDDDGDGADDDTVGNLHRVAPAKNQFRFSRSTGNVVGLLDRNGGSGSGSAGGGSARLSTRHTQEEPVKHVGRQHAVLQHSVTMPGSEMEPIRRKVTKSRKIEEVRNRPHLGDVGRMMSQPVLTVSSSQVRIGGLSNNRPTDAASAVDTVLDMPTTRRSNSAQHTKSPLMTVRDPQKKGVRRVSSHVAGATMQRQPSRLRIISDAFTKRNSSQKVIREPGQITKAKSMANLALVNVRRPSSSDDETESESISDSGQSMSTVSSSSMEFLSPREKEQIAGDGFTDFCVADLSLLEFGREEIELAETEMIGLLEVRRRYGKNKPLTGANIIGCMHLNIETAVLVETLVELGANVRWCSNNMYSTQDEAAAALAARQIPVFAWKGETEEEYWWCIHQCCVADGWKPNLILDTGGEATAYFAENFPDKFAHLKGVTEETPPGVHRLYDLVREGQLTCPAINVSDSVTKQKFDTFFACRESVLETIYRASDMFFAGKKAVVAGYGDVGKGLAEALKGAGMVVYITEIDPICALQACMAGFRVTTMDDACGFCDLFVTATGNRSIITKYHMSVMKEGALVLNYGHWDSEIDVASLRQDRKIRFEDIKPHVDYVIFPDGKKIILLAEGRPANHVFSSGHQSFVLSIAFTNQVLALMDLYMAETGHYGHDVYLLPKHLDEEVARLHLSRFDAELTVMTQDQARYLGVPVRGPFKIPSYRY